VSFLDFFYIIRPSLICCDHVSIQFAGLNFFPKYLNYIPSNQRAESSNYLLLDPEPIFILSRSKKSR